MSRNKSSVTEKRGRNAGVFAVIACAFSLAFSAGSALAAGHDEGLPNIGLQPPLVPASGAYIGAWVNPEGRPSYGGASEIAQLPRFNSYIGGTVQILHLFVLFNDPFPSNTMNKIVDNGSIPLLDWNCGSVEEISAGRWDSTISQYAQAFRRFGKPAFLRWYWEMNVNSPAHQVCGASKHGPQFIAAWQRIWTIFHQNGATNVAFVWCPLSHGPNLQYYPGDAYVDWVGADAFDRAHDGPAAFRRSFTQFYNQWAVRKPMMVGATGATGLDQMAYVRGIQEMLPSQYPRLKGVLYFHAPGDGANWSLTGNGLAALRTLVHTPYFVVQ